MHVEHLSFSGSFAHVQNDILARLARVKLLILDVDGVMTDGGLYFDAEGRVIKRFNVLDGLGIGIARKQGLKIAVITGQDVPAVAARMRQLRIEDYFAGFIDKRDSYEMCRAKHNLSSDEVAYLGDDWVDLPILAVVGMPMAVANAVPEVRAAATYITTLAGGHGAVREAIHLILHSKGVLETALDEWLEQPAL